MQEWRDNRRNPVAVLWSDVKRWVRRGREEGSDGLARMRSLGRVEFTGRSDHVGSGATRLGSSEPPSHLLLLGLHPAAAAPEQKRSQQIMRSFTAIQNRYLIPYKPQIKTNLPEKLGQF